MIRQRLMRAAMIAGVALCCIYSGCEDSPDTENASTYFDGFSVDSTTNRPSAMAARMQITPDKHTIDTDGNAAQFTVACGSGSVRWSVLNAGRGRILTQSSDAATYRRLTAGDNIVIATDSRGISAFAVVSQPPGDAMQVTPPGATLDDDGNVAMFTVKGAVGSVAWSVSDAAKGTILTQTDTSATYRRIAAGDNVVIAADSQGSEAFAVITQP